MLLLFLLDPLLASELLLLLVSQKEWNCHLRSGFDGVVLQGDWVLDEVGDAVAVEVVGGELQWETSLSCGLRRGVGGVLGRVLRCLGWVLGVVLGWRGWEEEGVPPFAVVVRLFFSHLLYLLPQPDPLLTIRIKSLIILSSPPQLLSNAQQRVILQLLGNLLPSHDLAPLHVGTLADEVECSLLALLAALRCGWALLKRLVEELALLASQREGFVSGFHHLLKVARFGVLCRLCVDQ